MPVGGAEARFFLQMDSKVDVGNMRVWLEPGPDSIRDIRARVNPKELFSAVIKACGETYTRLYTDRGVSMNVTVDVVKFEGSQISYRLEDSVSSIFATEEDGEKRLVVHLRFQSSFCNLL